MEENHVLSNRPGSSLLFSSYTAEGRKPFRILTGWKGDPFLLNSFLCVKINNNGMHIEIHKGERIYTNDGIKKMAAEPGRK